MDFAERRVPSGQWEEEASIALVPIIEQWKSETEVENAPGKDLRISAYAEAMLGLIEENELLRYTIYDALETRRQIVYGTSRKPDQDILPSYQSNYILRALQKQLLHRSEEVDYPMRFTTPEPWKNFVSDLLVKPEFDAGFDEFVSDISYRNVTSNIVERGVAFPLLTAILADRFGKKVEVLDIGPSQNHVLIKWAIAKFSPFGDIEVEQAVSEGSKTLYAPDPLMTHYVNRLIKKGNKLASGVGVDIMPIDVNNKEHAEVCSFYPSEYLDETKKEAYYLLDLASPSQVSFMAADFSKLDLGLFEARYPGQRFDIASFTTILYQCSPRVLNAMIQNARALLKPNGLIVVQDFVQPDIKNPSHLKFYKNWFDKPYKYRTLILDPNDPSGTFNEVFRWWNGRCKKVQVIPDALAKLALSQQTALS